MHRGEQVDNMWKLVKYELRKQMQSKLVIFGIVALLEIIWFIGLFTKERVLYSTSALLFMIANISMLYLYFESVVTFSHDLKTKNSYMMFMTPNSSYKIVGAKILASGIQILVYGLCFFGIGVLDIGIMTIRFNSVSETIEMVKKALHHFVHIDVDKTFVFLYLLTILIAGIFILVLAYVSITLSATFLANKPYKGVVSFAIFIAISYVVGKISNVLIGDGDVLFRDNKTMLLFIVWYTVLSAIAYVVTAWMLEKKVSL
jgi:ABC-2 type transport system permease protein